MAQLCILHANCQGEELTRLLALHADFSRLFFVRHVLNYTREPIEQQTLDSCALYLYQYLGPHFGDYSSESFLARLPSSCLALPIPNFFFKGYWPFWTNATTVIDFANSLLETLLARNLPKEMVLSLYLKGRLPDFDAVPTIAETSLATEREKETKLAIRYSHLIAEYWHDEALFYTVNHPGTRLFCHLARELFSLLSLAPLPPAVYAGFTPSYADFCLPIHPEVGRRLGLHFTGDEVRYPVLGKAMTHKDYVIAYLACRQHGIQNIAAFLRERAEHEEAEVLP